MRKSRPFQRSNWTSEVNDDDTELGSRTILIKQKKKKKRKKPEDRNSSIFSESDVHETQFKDTDTDNSIEKTVPSDGPKKEKSKIPDKDELKESKAKSIDVVVDIHREFKEEKSRKHDNNPEKLETSEDKNRRKSKKEPKITRMFTKRNVLHDRTNEKFELNPIKSQRLQSTHDEARIVESLDLIEEFQESTMDNHKNEKIFEPRKGRPTNEQKQIEEKPRARRQWDAPENLSQAEDSKKPRKRWSKDTTVIRLPETKSISSSASSIENVSPLKRDPEGPVPVGRSMLKQDTFFSFDNNAFASEDEDILRVETDHNRARTKILMRKVTDRLEETETSSSSNRGRSGSLKNKISEATVIEMEPPDEPKLENRKLRKQNKESMIVDIENSEDSDVNDSSLKGRIVGRGSKNDKKRSDKKKFGTGERKSTIDSSSSQSLQDIARRSSVASSEEELTKRNESWASKRGKKIIKDSRVKSRKHSSQETLLSTNEDEKDRSRETRLQDGSAKSTERRRRRSRSEDDRTRKKEEKKKVFRNREISSSTVTQYSNVEEDSKKKKKKKQKKEEIKKDVKYISVTIHRADTLEIDYTMKHPMVKVHIVHTETGKYLKNMQEDVASTYLQPIVTGKFDFRENRSMIPVWEEELIFEHDFEELLIIENKQVVILFEIIDLLSFADASCNYDKFGNEGCWYKVAWAFLKPVGRNNALHTNKKIRLQLYRPQRILKKFDRQKCEVYTWWKSSIREKYPSSLFVTVAPIAPPKLEPVVYQQLSLYDLSDVRSESQKTSTRTSESLNLPKWTRLAAQSCKIPNESFFETEISENGCFFVAFSNDGKYLACVLSEEYDYPIMVYEVAGKKIHVRFLGHKTFVYSLNWSSNDDLLLSVSSDQTARVWDVRNQIVQHVEMMPHPSYVYCGKFDPGNASIVATGCYDRVTRIWVKDKKSKNRDLSQELEGHEGFINSMSFQKDGNLLTADSIGIIIIWIVKKSRRTISRKEWHISRKIKVREIEGVIVNTIVLHPLESRLLVHSRNNGLRMLDLATGVVLQKYSELNNQRIQSTACISPCGSLILCGGEDSSLNIWNLETGNYLAKYTIDRNFRAVTCVDYHPYDHVLAFSTFGSPAPVRVLRFNKDTTGENVGLKIMEGAESRKHNSDVTMSLLNVSLPSGGKTRSNSRKRISDESSREINPRLSRALKSIPYDPAREDVLRGVDVRGKNAKFKLQKLNDTEQSLKNRSASRLYNIIEKIDRILSNTSRSSDDVETGRASFIHERHESQELLVLSEKPKREKRKSSKSKSSTSSSIKDHSSSYFESSTSSSVKREILEVKSLEETNVKKERSKSAKETRVKRNFDDDLSRTFSDSAANSRKLQAYSGKVLHQQNMESSFIVQQIVKGENPKIFHKNNCFATDQSSSASSAGTYVVEKAEVERNNDKSSIKTSGNDASSYSDVNSDLRIAKISEHESSVFGNATFARNAKKKDLGADKISESECSVLSNATFTIENEIPIPKPRTRKKELA